MQTHFNIQRVLLVPFIALILANCSHQKQHNHEAFNETEPPGDLARSELAREVHPQVSSENLQKAVQGNTNFAVDLYGKIKREKQNIFFPL